MPKHKAYIWGSVGLDQDAGSDRGHGNWHGAREPLASQEDTQIMIVGVDKTSEVTTRDGQGRAFDDGGREGTRARGADHLVDAEGVRVEGEGGDVDLGGA